MMRRAILLIALWAATLPAVAAQEPADTAAQRVNVVTRWFNNLSSRLSVNGYGLVNWSYSSKAVPSNEFSVSKVILMAGYDFTPHIKGFVMFNLRGPSLTEAWGSYSLSPAFNVKFGQFKTPFSMENPLSPTVLELADEDALVTKYMVMGNNPLMMPGSGGRDLGLTVYGNLAGGRVSYDLAVMNGNGRNLKDNNSAKDIVVRLAFKPIASLTIGGSAIWGRGFTEVHDDGNGHWVSDEAPGVEGIKPSGRFTRNRYAVGAWFKQDRWSLRGEWMWGRDGTTNSNGCYVTGRVSDIGVKNLGAVASFDHLDMVSGIVNRYSAGLEYWFYPKCRLQAGYSYAKWAGTTGEHRILTQLQLAF